ncbi:MAG: ATP-grasp domain-containing protein [Opitutales bacterium]|nr:ATP-grasp domain-containing protein [Opitutales bacterium]
MFSKILIANRGLIQANCVRAVKELGARAITIYAPNDKNSAGVRNADEAYELEVKASGIPYLDIEQIVDLAVKLKVDAVHPGYGFLAQNADFNAKLKEKKICLITPKHLEGYDLADKPQIRSFAQTLGLPILPGTDTCNDLESLKKSAAEIGYPIVMKAAEGYGGIGLRVIDRESVLEANYRNVLSQADRHLLHAPHEVYLEKYFTKAKHIEFPVARDAQGNMVVFPERECTIQRRYQKLVTETPSSCLTDALRGKLKSAVELLMNQLAIQGFVSVEFLYDGDQAYFLEINSYIQPSHAVSALLTGVDMLREQVSIASDAPLSFSSKDITNDDVAMGVFVSAEDTDRNFTPSPGKIERLDLPYGDGVYSLTNVSAGDTVGTFYDPIVALVMAKEISRSKVISKMRTALDALHIDGIKTSIPLMRALMRYPAFSKGEYDSEILATKESRDAIFDNIRTPEESEIAAMIAALSLHRDSSKQHLLDEARENSKKGKVWEMAAEWFNRQK